MRHRSKIEKKNMKQKNPILGSKNHCIYSVVWTAPSKNTGICAFFIMLQEVICPCKSHKTPVNYSIWGLLFCRVRWGRGGGGAPKVYSNLLNSQAAGLATLPFTSKTQGSPTGATFRDLPAFLHMSSGSSLYTD